MRTRQFASFLAFVLLSAVAGLSLAEDTPAKPENRTWSPLHAFLGIDPQTGEFLSESEIQQRRQARAEKARLARDARRAQTAELAATDDAKATASAAEKSQDAVQVTPELTTQQIATELAENLRDASNDQETSEALTTAVRDLLENSDRESLDPLASLLPSSFEPSEAMSLSHRVGWLVTLLLLIFPARIVLSEATGLLLRRGDATMTDVDRRYYRKRLRRRLLMAALIAVVLVLVPWGVQQRAVWENPGWLTTFWATIVVLSVWAWLLSVAVKRAAKWHSQAVVRELRRQQLELQQEVEELRKRLSRYELAAGR